MSQSPKQLSAHRISNKAVAAVFRKYPKAARDHLRYLRRLIIEVATVTDGVGILEETLKWGEPSYVTAPSKTGSAIRIDWKSSDPDRFAIYFKCTTNLVSTFQRRYPNLFSYGGTRSIHFDLGSSIPETELKQCIALALTYHRNKNLPANKRWESVCKIESTTSR